jgi:hypothetical protein
LPINAFFNFLGVVDYSTIEREYPSNNNSLNNKESSNTSVIDRDGERRSLANNRGGGSSSSGGVDNVNNLANIVGEINTKYMKGPNTFQPNNMSLIEPQDLPNIDIGFNKSSSQRSQNPPIVNYSNRSFQPQQPALYHQEPGPAVNSNTQQPQQQGGKGRVQFPSRNNRVPQQQQQQQPVQQSSQRYVPSKKKILKQIFNSQSN